MKPSNKYPEDPYDKYRRPFPNSPYEPNPHDPWDKQTPPPKPRVVTIADLFPRLDRLSIGWSPLLETLKEVTNNKPSYPPYDVIALEDDTNLLNVAVAGFAKTELSIRIQDSVLTVEGQKEDKQKGLMVYQGIAARDFKLELAIAEFWEVIGAEIKDGLLTVTFKKELPEEKKPKVIDIS
jgi:molecular chaperone IbpA